METLPTPPKFTFASLGPGIVLIAMGLGAGEYILWPFLISKFGFGILWGALLGITLQFFLIIETCRYTLIKGQSIYFAFSKLNKIIPYWFIISTFLSFVGPGIIITAGTLFDNLIGANTNGISSIVFLICIGLIITFGGEVYNRIEKIQKIIIFLSIPALLFIMFLVGDLEIFKDLTRGVFGFGNGYRFIPKEISIFEFLGAIAYTGAAGNLILSYSIYIKDKGFGMANFFKFQMKLNNKIYVERKEIDLKYSYESIKNFRGWIRLLYKEQFSTFWFLGLISVFVLSVISFSLVYPYSNGENLDFVFNISSSLSSKVGNFFGVLYLVVGIVFLFKTQLGILETIPRIISENFVLILKKQYKNMTINRLYFFILWLVIFISSAMVIFFREEPLLALLISTFFSALSTLVLTFLVLILNTNKDFIPKKMQPSLRLKIILYINILFYSGLVFITAKENLLNI